MDLPVIQDFIVGFKQGAKTIDPSIEIQVSFIGNFNDAQKAYDLTRNMLNNGVDVVFNVAGPAGLGILKAAADANKYAIGVDSDQNGLYPKNVAASMLKQIGNSIYDSIKQIEAGKAPFGTLEIYGLKNDGVGLVYNDALVPAAVKAKVERRQGQGAERSNQGRQRFQDAMNRAGGARRAAALFRSGAGAMTERSVGPMLRLRGLVKKFGDKIALDHIDLEVQEGEIHVICGENGAGKSTLMNILAGIMRPDAGDIFLDGAPAALVDPIAASAAGIGMVHQHFKLVPSMTVAENLYLNRQPRRLGFVDRPRSDEETGGGTDRALPFQS